MDISYFIGLNTSVGIGIFGGVVTFATMLTDEIEEYAPPPSSMLELFTHFLLVIFPSVTVLLTISTFLFSILNPLLQISIINSKIINEEFSNGVIALRLVSLIVSIRILLYPIKVIRASIKQEGAIIDWFWGITEGTAREVARIIDVSQNTLYLIVIASL